MNKQDICAFCGHYRFLHDDLNGECKACDDPTIPITKKCQYFHEKDHWNKTGASLSYER